MQNAVRRLGVPRTARLTGASVLIALVIMASLVSVAPARASVPAPTGLRTSSDAIPVFEWDRVPGATGYVVQLASSASFSTTIVGPEATSNTRWTPTRLLPSGVVYWRVQAVGTDGTPSAWSSRSTTIGATSAPTPVSPTSGADVRPPTDPPVLTWTVVPGSTGYDVEMEANGNWESAGVDSRTTKTNSLVWPITQEPGDYFWRVRARLGDSMATAWSSGAQYDVLALPGVTATACPAGLSCTPKAGGQAHPEAILEDVVLDWDPVLGAHKYELRIGLTREFSPVVDNPTVSGTRYSPATTYANNGFFWQVRPINAAGAAGAWPTPVNTFVREWDQKPTLTYPIGAAGDDLYYQWSPVRHASTYELQVGSEANFTPGTFETCLTSQTTFTPGDLNQGCTPGQGGATYWRVRALDDPKSVVSLWSTIGQFTHDSGLIPLVSPSSGDTVTVPTLRWQASDDTQSYDVEITDNAGNSVFTKSTFATSWTPPGELPVGSYRWTVVSVDADGSRSPRLLTGRPFTLVAPPAPSGPSLVPLTGGGGPATSRFPHLSWTPHPGAASYRLKVRVGTGVLGPEQSPVLSAQLFYPATTDWGTRFLTSGTYVWWVEAYDDSNVQMATGPEAQFVIEDPAAVTNQGIALDGQALDVDDRCTVRFSPGDLDSTCQGVPSTPVLDWDPVPGAGGYQVFLAEDPSLTTLVQVEYTKDSRWIPTQALPDNESRPAYYWFVRPCKAISPPVGCAYDPAGIEDVATNAFRKVSPRVELTSPAAEAQFADEVTFTWQDYRLTNDTVTYAGGAAPSHQSAQQYEIQVSTSDTFGNVVDSAVVDQSTYTSPGTYPEGELWWRVRAIDAAGNPLAWSLPRSMSKETPVANLDPAPNPSATERPGMDVTTPTWNQHLTSGGKPFTWTAAVFDGTWTVEIYRNDDTSLSPGNHVLTLGSQQAAFSWSEFLPPSSEAYRWRLRRTDVNGHNAQWSDFGRFFVDEVNQQLSSPAAGNVEPPNGPLFRWTGIAGAASYQVEVEGRDNPTALATDTAATAWAVSSDLPSGSYRWRVTPLDANGQRLGGSGWRDFSVDGALRATSSTQIHAPTGTGVGQTLTSTPPGWSQTDVTNDYQWQRGGQDIPGATGPAYVVTAEDYQQVLTLRVTGSRPGYTQAVSVSNSLNGSAGGAIVATSPPALSGVPKVGESLRVQPGAWSETTPDFTFEWLRNGVVIAGVTGDSYLLQAQDAATTISARVFADKPALNRGSATTNGLAIAKLASSTTTTLSTTRAKPKKKVKVTVTVAVPETPRPTGTIKLYDGSKVITTLSLSASRGGVVTFTYKKLKKGKHKIKAVFSGDTATTGSTSKPVKLVVKR